jgi:hypothetical protein
VIAAAQVRGCSRPAHLVRGAVSKIHRPSRQVRAAAASFSSTMMPVTLYVDAATIAQPASFLDQEAWSFELRPDIIRLADARSYLARIAA